MNARRQTVPAVRPWPGPFVAALMSLLTACAARQELSLPTPPPASPPIAASTQTSRGTVFAPVIPKADSARDRFEAQQLDRAAQATRLGHLADTALAWEVLSVLRPANGHYRRRWVEARAAIESAVVQGMARASAARRRGDASIAERAWLEVLALEPRHATAAQALRDLERERNQASVVGRFAQPPAIGGRTAPSAVTQAPLPRGRVAMAAPTSPGQRNQFEHASMLAGQGEIDAAIALLTEHTTRSTHDAQMRLLLADLHVQRAERRPEGDSVAAAEDLERALQLNPRLDNARLKLQQLRRQPQ